MKIKIRCKSGVVAMNFRRKSKGSFECSREASYLVSNFMCEKGDLKFVNVLSVRIPKRFKYGTALSLLQANNHEQRATRTLILPFNFNLTWSNKHCISCLAIP